MAEDRLPSALAITGHRLPYVEGYPRLLGPEVWRLFSQGVGEVRLCRFQTNRGREVGWLEALSRRKEGLEARWKFFSPGISPDCNPGIIWFAPGEQRAGRPSPFRCTTCKRRVGNLVFVTCWRCAKCEGLRNRSTFLGREVAESERAIARLSLLRGQIGAGRPKHMKQATYQALRQELRNLERRPQRLERVTANVDRTEVISGEWMTVATAEGEHSYNPQIIFRDEYTGDN